MIRRAANSCVAVLLAGFVQVAAAQAAPTVPVNLKVYVGGQQRPDLMRELFAQYSAAHPGVNISLEIGGATSELNQKYLNMVLTAKDSTLDIFLIDIIQIGRAHV